MREVAEGVGASRGLDGVLRRDVHNPGDGWGPVADERGAPLLAAAMFFGVTRIVLTEAVEAMSPIREGTHNEITGFRQRIQTLRETESVEDAGTGIVVLIDKIRARLNFDARCAADEQRILVDLEGSLEASRRHFDQNYAGYYAVAIEEANAAGVDINFAGHDYPAPTA